MNSPTENHPNTNSFIKKKDDRLKKNLENGDGEHITPDEFRILMTGLCERLAKKAIQKPEQLNNVITELTNKKESMMTLSGAFEKIQKTYFSVYMDRKIFLNEEVIIAKLERKSHTRNIIARGLTTLVIGFSVMAVYWVAHILEIPMPMLKLPTS